MRGQEVDPVRVLIVEDEAVIALDLESLLRSWGYAVVGIAPTGAHALRLADAHRPQIALLDIRLRGGMDGIDTASALQAEHGMPLVFLTAYADRLTLQRAGGLRPVGYLLKPIDQPLLRATLELARQRYLMDREREQLAQREGRTQALLSAMMDGCPDAMLAVDSLGKVAQVNRRALELTGHARAGLVGQSLQEVVDLSPEHARQQARTGDIYEADLRMAGGESLPVEIAAALVPFEGDALLSLVLRDRSEAKALLAQRDRQNRLEASGRLAAGVAHDLCGLLTSMKCSSYLIRERGDTDVAEEARQLDDAIARGSALLGNLLGFVRSGPADFEPVDCGALVQGLDLVLRHAVGPRATLEVARSPGKVFGQQTRLEQLLLNLVFNARDAIEPEGAVRVMVEQCTAPRGLSLSGGRLEAGDYVVLRVADDGVGITDEVMPHIFDPFFSTKLERQGTGLGLVTVMDVLAEHDGRLDVRAGEHGGTIVSAYLPAYRSNAGAAAQAQARADLAALHSKPAARQASVWHLLLVDDEVDGLRPLVEWLRRAGHVVDTCTGPEQALAHLGEGKRVDCVVTDVVMEGMDGLSLSRAASARGLAAPFLYVTGYHRDSLRDMGYDVTGVNVMAKPVDEAALAVALHRIVSGEGRHGNDGAGAHLDRG